MSPMQVLVLTRPINSPSASSETKRIDWNNSSDRKWLTNHMHWAMNNGHAVALRPIAQVGAFESMDAASTRVMKEWAERRIAESN